VAAKSTKVKPAATKKTSQIGDFSVTKAQNGYVISVYGAGKSKTFIAKDKAEMKVIVNKLLGGKK
jgi:hypothetical protein